MNALSATGGRFCGTYAAFAIWAIICAVILGGGSRGAYLAGTALQLATIPVLLLALNEISRASTPRRIKLAAISCGLIALVPLLQIVPLPPLLWNAIPAHKIFTEMFDLTGQSTVWMPLSVTPAATQLAITSLIPAAAIFLVTLLLDRAERRLMTLVLLAAGLISVILGITQVARGPNSRLRFFEFTNLTEAVGFFANRNHFASLLYVLLVFASFWTIHATLTEDVFSRRNPLNTALILKIGWFSVLVLLIVAQALTRSRAGMGLTILALLGAFGLAALDKRATGNRNPTRLIFSGAAVVAILLSGEFVLYRLMERFASDPLADARVTFSHATVEAARSFMPLGSGLASFAPIYAMFEHPETTIANIYANQAHNEFLQLWLEEGVLGIALMIGFGVWLVVRLITIWNPKSIGTMELDIALMRAASIAVVLLIAHSSVDYPLRTGAMMSVMAFCCALLIEPPDEARRRQSASPTRSHAPSLAPITPPLPPAERANWGKSVEWPDAWRTQSNTTTTPAKPKTPAQFSKPPEKPS